MGRARLVDTDRQQQHRRRPANEQQQQRRNRRQSDFARRVIAYGRVPLQLTRRRQQPADHKPPHAQCRWDHRSSMANPTCSQRERRGKRGPIAQQRLGQPHGGLSIATDKPSLFELVASPGRDARTRHDHHRTHRPRLTIPLGNFPTAARVRGLDERLELGTRYWCRVDRERKRQRRQSPNGSTNSTASFRIDGGTVNVSRSNSNRPEQHLAAGRSLDVDGGKPHRFGHHQRNPDWQSVRRQRRVPVLRGCRQTRCSWSRSGKADVRWQVHLNLTGGQLMSGSGGMVLGSAGATAGIFLGGRALVVMAPWSSSRAHRRPGSARRAGKVAAERDVLRVAEGIALRLDRDAGRGVAPVSDMGKGA